MNNCKKMDKKCEYADRLGMCENITATCARNRTMRLINADALKANVPNTNVDIFENCRNCNTLMDWQVKELIDKMPTIDAVEVVRCRDCKHWNPNGIGICKLHDIRPTPLMMDDWFCADGERRDPCSSQDS